MTTRTSPGLRARLADLGLTPTHIGRSFGAIAPADVKPGDNIADVTIPDSPAALEEMLGNWKDTSALAKAGLLPEAIAKYGRVCVEKDVEIQKQVAEGVQKVTQDFFRDHAPEGLAPRVEVPANFNGGGATRMPTAENRAARRAGTYNPNAMGAKIDDLFNGAGEYFQAIWHGNTQRTAEVQNKIAKVKNAFSSNVPSEGGFLIPEVLRSELLTVALETAIVRPRARVIPMDSLRVPFPAVDSTTNATSVFGGIICYWTQEAGTLTDSSAKFSQIVLDAKKLTAYTEVPNELIADSVISFEAYINQIFPEALAFYEDYAFLQGTGVGEPLGLLTAKNTAMVSTTKEALQPADTIVWENIVKMFARMLPNSLNRAVWLVSPDTFPELATMALSVGTGGSAVWLNNGAAGPPMTILGRPVIVTEKASVLGDAGDIAFVDLGMYLVGDRQAMSATSSMHFKFQNDVTAYRIIERVDGRPWLQSAITPKNGGATLSPFVQLEART
jgi:HK97 family phage major capsid protein